MRWHDDCKSPVVLICCDSLLSAPPSTLQVMCFLSQCYLFHMYVGVRAGGGIGDEIEDPAGDEYELYRVVFDITFFFFVIVILLAIIQGKANTVLECTFKIKCFGCWRQKKIVWQVFQTPLIMTMSSFKVWSLTPLGSSETNRSKWRKTWRYTVVHEVKTAPDDTDVQQNVSAHCFVLCRQNALYVALEVTTLTQLHMALRPTR